MNIDPFIRQKPLIAKLRSTRRRTEDACTEVRIITGQMSEEARKILTQVDRLAKKLITESSKQNEAS